MGLNDGVLPVLGGFLTRARRIGPRVGEPSVIGDQHPLIATYCYGCGEPFRIGDQVALVAIGPGDDGDEQRLWYSGRWTMAVGLPLHYACAGLPEPPETDP